MRKNSWSNVDLEFTLEFDQEKINKIKSPLIKTYFGEADFVEMTIKASCSGYYDPGKISGPPENCYPPEGEDERTLGEIKLLFYNEDGEINTIVIDEQKTLYEFAREFEEEIYEQEIDTDDYYD